MGTGWSQDEAAQSQPQEDLRATSHSGQSHNGMIPKTTEAKIDEPHSQTILKDKPVGVAKPVETKPKAPVQEVKPPHVWEVILENADSPIDRSSTDKLYEQLYHGVFLNQKRMKYWIDKRSKCNCFMLFPRKLSITWGDDVRYWAWFNLNQYETSNDNLEVAELLNVAWLELHGKFDMKCLNPRILYEVTFVIMLKDVAYGWEDPVNFRLTLPNGMKQERKEVLRTKARWQWLEVPVGEFRTSPENTGEMEIYMYEYHGGKWKRGLVVKGVVIRPKNNVPV